MNPLPVILIFDVGKTNKKILLFDEHYSLVKEEIIQFKEITDEDGYPCEDVAALTRWITTCLHRAQNEKKISIKAINFSAYGASIVYLNDHLKPFLPLYNYLKPYPVDLEDKFYTCYGGKTEFSKRTASPALGSLNSGLQLYRLKHEKPSEYAKVRYAVHLPQYLSTVLSTVAYSEITSIGCHTNLWDFTTNHYHTWVTRENIISKLPPTIKSDSFFQLAGTEYPLCTGIGLHDSSAALIPYLKIFKEPFILLSTGTWCISLNPFNNTPLTREELQKDCLCYLTHQGNAVKASRLFAGHIHEQQIKRLADFYNKPVDYFTKIHYKPKNIKEQKPVAVSLEEQNTTASFTFQHKDLTDFETYEEAYYNLIIDIVKQQIISTQLVLQGTSVKKIFVDGGFSKNNIYMHVLASAFPEIEVYAASIAQASALGAAFVIHNHWNSNAISANTIKLKLYATPNKA
jgi:sugar (pentulose or hexulose) kinase